MSTIDYDNLDRSQLLSIMKEIPLELKKRDKSMKKDLREKMHKLADILRKRGMRDLQFSVTACQLGRKKRILFDEYANRTGEKDIGGC